MKMERRVVIDLKYSVWFRQGEELARPELMPEYVQTALEKACKGDHTDVLAEANGCIFGLISSL